MTLLKDILGMNIVYSKWIGEKKLPLYMTGNFDYQKADIESNSFIIMNLKTELPTLPALKKQIKRVQDIEPVPVVIKVPAMSAFRRKNMIENHIPFIIAEEQAYLPFMGTYLSAKCENSKSNEKQLLHFRISTQQLLLWYFYQPDQKAYITDASKKCSFSAMTMSRATKELEKTGIVKVEKDGVKKYLTCNCSKKELFESTKQYMKSPVVAEGYLDIRCLDKNMIPSGITALAEWSMLNADKLKTYASTKVGFDRGKLRDELIDPNKQIKLELWEYDPFLFAIEGYADPISVALSLMKENDERVEMMVEEMLEELWEKTEW